jgi:hypothetical protein
MLRRGTAGTFPLAVTAAAGQATAYCPAPRQHRPPPSRRHIDRSVGPQPSNNSPNSGCARTPSAPSTRRDHRHTHRACDRTCTFAGDPCAFGAFSSYHPPALPGSATPGESALPRPQVGQQGPGLGNSGLQKVAPRRRGTPVLRPERERVSGPGPAARAASPPRCPQSGSKAVATVVGARAECASPTISGAMTLPAATR